MHLNMASFKCLPFCPWARGLRRYQLTGPHIFVLWNKCVAVHPDSSKLYNDDTINEAFWKKGEIYNTIYSF